MGLVLQTRLYSGSLSKELFEKFYLISKNVRDIFQNLLYNQKQST